MPVKEYRDAVPRLRINIVVKTIGKSFALHNAYCVGFMNRREMLQQLAGIGGWRRFFLCVGQVEQNVFKGSYMAGPVTTSGGGKEVTIS